MPSSSTLYTTGVMESVTASVSTGGSATGHGIYSGLDFNPDTYWKADASNNIAIDIDLGSVQTIDQFAVWIHDYDTTYEGGSPPHGIALVSDDNDNGAYSATTTFASGVFTDSAGSPIYFPASSPTPTTKRYWQIQLVNLNSATAVVPEISQFFLLRKREISKGNEYPETDSKKFFNAVKESAGGRQFVQAVNSQYVNIFPRSYVLSGSAWTSSALYLAHQDSKGRRFPLILSESSSNYLVRFDSDELSKAEQDYQYYTPSVRFVELPHIPDGSAY